MAWSKPDAAPLGDGASLRVLNTTQGGLVTEFDVAITGVAEPDFDTLYVDVVDNASAPLASQQYNGAGLPLTCRDDGVLEVSSLPVGFDVDPDVGMLNGAAATVALVVETPDATVDVSWAVVLRIDP